MQQIEAFVETGLFLYSLRREISYRVGFFCGDSVDLRLFLCVIFTALSLAGFNYCHEN